MNEYKISGQRSGQAMMEFLIGLIAVLAVFAGIIQLATLSRAQRVSMDEARIEASIKAMLETKSTEDKYYLKNVKQGERLDGTKWNRYTAHDDTTDQGVVGIWGNIDNEIVAKSASSQSRSGESDWDILNKTPSEDNMNEISKLHATPNADLGLVKGSVSTNIELIGVVKNIIFKHDGVGLEEILIESDVWMTWTRGIY